ARQSRHASAVSTVREIARILVGRPQMQNLMQNLKFRPLSLQFLAALAAAILLFVFAPLCAHADGIDIDLYPLNSALPPGSTANGFDVLLANGGPDVSIAGFFFEIT